MPENTRVDFWFDPVCPFAWATSRWVLEVGKVRPLEVAWHVMSLAVLNEGRGGKHGTPEAESWGPVRVVIAAARDHGDEVTGELYTAMGELLHHEKVRDHSEAIVRALETTGLPAGLAAHATLTGVDQALRASHQAGIGLVGRDVGTPVMAVNGTAFFGPVITRVPTGEEAGRLFDATVALALNPYFFELKRRRTERPTFTTG